MSRPFPKGGGFESLPEDTKAALPFRPSPSLLSPGSRPLTVPCPLVRSCRKLLAPLLFIPQGGCLETVRGALRDVHGLRCMGPPCRGPAYRGSDCSGKEEFGGLRQLLIDWRMVGENVDREAGALSRRGKERLARRCSRTIDGVNCGNGLMVVMDLWG